MLTDEDMELLPLVSDDDDVTTKKPSQNEKKNNKPVNLDEDIPIQRPARQKKHKTEAQLEALHAGRKKYHAETESRRQLKKEENEAIEMLKFQLKDANKRAKLLPLLRGEKEVEEEVIVVKKPRKKIVIETDSEEEEEIQIAKQVKTKTYKDKTPTPKVNKKQSAPPPPPPPTISQQPQYKIIFS